MNKDLELAACKVFVCPNLNKIDIIGKKLELTPDYIKDCKDLAIKYLKKTYHCPKYSSINTLLPAFIYINAIINKDCVNRRTQMEITEASGVSGVALHKWYKEILNELNLLNSVHIIERKHDRL